MDTYEARAAQKLHAAEVAPKPDGIRPMEAAWILAFLYLLVAWLETSDVSQQVVEERHQQIVERGCVAQYGPGERAMKKKPLECVEMVEAPNHILTLPVVQ